MIFQWHFFHIIHFTEKWLIRTFLFLNCYCCSTCSLEQNSLKIFSSFFIQCILWVPWYGLNRVGIKLEVNHHHHVCIILINFFSLLLAIDAFKGKSIISCFHPCYYYYYILIWMYNVYITLRHEYIRFCWIILSKHVFCSWTEWQKNGKELHLIQCVTKEYGSIQSYVCEIQ